MPLVRGARLGPYRIDAEIGAGGMGHVFRATDTRLERAVAIKVLPQHRWTDAKVRHRFEREARALSSLSHPNLCALYDIGELNQSGASTPYLVMELLEGETLRDRLQSGRLGMRKALAWAAQIAAGLAAAHAKGVVHRDLKPENVYITGGQLLKILDFGLALTTETTESTATAMRTDPGMIMGTSHYMSPEQVRGDPLDARSDIFSLGVVLFEMLTGQVPFHARSAVETMNSILTDDPPDLQSLIPSVPDAVESIVRRCLEKDPAQRFSSAHDLAFALESAARQVTSSTPSPARRRTPSAAVASVTPDRTRMIAIALLVLAFIAAVMLSRRNSSDAPNEPPRLRTLTYSGRDSAPAASPDGKLIAYVSTRDGMRRIWLKQLGDGTEAAVTAGPDDTSPRFSPDGSSLLFTRGGALYRVAVLGGEPRKLIDNAIDGDWSPDGQQIAFVRERSAPARVSTMCVARIDGGEARELISTTTEELAAPRWSPDGRSIAITRAPRGTNAGSLLVLDLTSGDKQVLSRKEPHGVISGAAWTRDGNALVYIELEALASAGMPRRRGSSVVVLHELDGDARVLLRNPHSAADTIDIIGNDRLVFAEDLTRQSLQEVTLDGSKPPRWLTRGTSVDRQPSYARNGASVVFASDRGGNVDVWELMLANGSLHRLTEHAGIDWDPHPAADGQSLFWSSNRGGHFEIWTASIDGASPRQVTKDGVDAENPSMPSHGEWLVYDSSNPKSDGIWRMPRGGGAPSLVFAGETIHPEVSADGQYVVYQRPEPGGTGGINVVRVADGKVFSLVSGVARPTLLRPRWIGNTHTIAFRGVDALFAQEFRPDADTSATRRQLTPSNPDAPPDTFAISADGKRGVIAVLDEASGLMVAEGLSITFP